MSLGSSLGLPRSTGCQTHDLSRPRGVRAFTVAEPPRHPRNCAQSQGYRIRARFHSQQPCSQLSQRTFQSRCVTECSNRPDAPGSPASPLSRSESSKSDERTWAVTLQAAQQRIGALLFAVLLVGNMVLVPPQPALARSRLTAEETSTVDLFKESTPSVVYITNLASRRDQFTMNIVDIPQGAGSGTIWDTAGHIVTNYHVIKGANELQVSLTGGGMMTGGDEYKASVVGFDEDKDVAVLKINVEADKKLKPLRLGTSSDLLVGQRVFAIGNPFGLDHTLTTGVISGTGREINSGNTGRPIQGVIQTDAAINPGNSGGPLLDSGGLMIGVNTAIYSPSGANSGVGFAIPVDALRRSVEQIIQFGKVVRPILGISFAPDQSVEQLGVSGILVLDARKDGPAFKSGIKGTTRDSYGRLVIGDVITAFKGVPIKGAGDLFRVLDRCEIGEVIDVEVLRDDAKEHVSITLEGSG